MNMIKRAINSIFIMMLFLSNISVCAAEIKNINLQCGGEVVFSNRILFVRDYSKIVSDICKSLRSVLEQAVSLSEEFEIMFFSKSQALHFIDSDINSLLETFRYLWLPY